MSIRRPTLWIATLVLLTGCGQQPFTPDSMEAEESPQWASVRSDQPTKPVSLRGTTSTAAGSGERVVTIDALSTPGTTEGSYRVELTGPGLFFEVDVSCLTRAGNTAWVAGHISDSNADIIELGTVSYLYVIDEGDGNGQFDVVSIARINDAEGQDELFCEEQLLLLPAAPVDAGDYKLRPKAH